MKSPAGVNWGTLLFRRGATALVTLWGVTVVTFFIVYRLPGDPAALLAGPRADPATISQIRESLGLNQPPLQQYGGYITRLVRGDLGVSYVRREPVSRLIAQRLPATLALGLTAWAIWLVLGSAIGVWAAARPTPLREGAMLAFSVIGVSTPTFWVGILLLYVFVSRLGWLPAGGGGSFKHMILPLAALSLTGVAYYSRLAHASLRGTLGQDFIRTARAKGLPESQVILRHGLRNALLPLVTLAGTDLASLLSGVVFTETVFDWKGMGLLAVESVSNLDIPMILGVVLISAVLVVASNLVVDLVYPLLDPRIEVADSAV